MENWSMLRYKYNDDGYYQTGYRIYEQDGKMFCDAPTEENAIEIVNAVNAIRIIEVERKLDGKNIR
jgi:hypothetical protein